MIENGTSSHPGYQLSVYYFCLLSQVLNQSSLLPLEEGGDTKDVYFRLWVNKTELCDGAVDCSVSLHFSVHADTSANTPR